jgi:hypothetical protein
MMLPWVLFLILDGNLAVETPFHYATYEDCISDGTIRAMAAKVELRLVNRTLEPKCLNIRK